MNTAIIVAAGRGTRFAGDRPKQFLDLAGKPVILHTIQQFQQCESIGSIIVVLPSDGFDSFVKILAESQSIKLKPPVRGGATRAESVRNGFLAIDSASPRNVIAVHDGARPLVTAGEISATVQMASEVGAACLVADLTDTIKQINGGVITGTVDRQTLRRALTPQAFRYEIFKEMLALALTDDTVTDECYLAEKLGVPIACVPGSGRNIKITRQSDLLLAATLLTETQVEQNQQ